MPSDQELEDAIREFLEGADINGITQGAIRQQLEQKFLTDLTPQKGLLKELLIKVINDKPTQPQQQEGEEAVNDAIADEAADQSEPEMNGQDGNRGGEEESGEADGEEGGEEGEVEVEAEAEEKPRKKRGGSGFNKDFEWSDVMAEVIGTKFCSRGQVTKRLWAYIKDHNLQNPSDRRTILCDDKLKAVFNCDRINMFKMTKAVQRHLWNNEAEGEGPREGRKRARREESESEEEEGEESASGEEEEEEGKVAVNGRGKRKKARKDGEEEKRAGKEGGGKKAGKEGKKRGGFPEQHLSEGMQKMVGQPSARRNEVVKALWVYIKGHELQNPENKNEIRCDQQLQDLFGVKTVTAFGINKYISKHMLERVKT